MEFVDSIELDLARRDFTMNAIAFHPTRGIFDPFDGASDIEARTIRAVGDARKRFEEDPLRILRAARFEAQTGFRPNRPRRARRLLRRWVMRPPASYRGSVPPSPGRRSAART